MLKRRISPLAEGYDYEVDATSEDAWHQLLTEFHDSNINQTLAYAAVEEGQGHLTTLKLRRNGEVVAIALARSRRLPVLGIGLAYVHRGPIWRRTGTEVNVENFRQVVRALRNEFVCKRGLTLRLNPALYEDDTLGLSAILADEGFLPVNQETHGKTILMDMAPPLAELREGMNSHWKRELKVAEKNDLEFIEGTSDELMDSFIQIHSEMASRKGFVVNANPRQFRQIQTQLPENLKMRILLCRSAEGLCAGAIYSRMGNSASYLFGATSNDGKKSRGSYFLQWKILQALKHQGTSIYDLNGIDPVANHGTYVFKRDLAGKNGREAVLIGKFDASAGLLSRSLLRLRDALKKRKAKGQESRFNASNCIAMTSRPSK